MTTPELPHQTDHLLPPGAAEAAMRIISPEEADAQLSAAQEIGVVDGEFQVWRNPAAGDSDGHFETGWTVSDALNKRHDDGSLEPVVVLEKVSEDPATHEPITETKTVNYEKFMSWQLKEERSADTLGDTVAHDMAAELTEDSELLEHKIAVADDIGETALEEAGAELVETATDGATEPEATDPVTAESGDEIVDVDLQAIFMSGSSLEAAMKDQSLPAEAKHQLHRVEQYWHETFGIARAVEQAWSEDLLPAAQAMLQELPQKVGSLHSLLERSQQLTTTLYELSRAYEERDADTAARLVQQLNLDEAVYTLKNQARSFSDQDEMLPSARHMRGNSEVAFERVNHAEHDIEMTPADYQQLADYVRPILADSKGLPAVITRLHDDTENSRILWRDIVKNTDTVSTISASLSPQVEDLVYLITALANSLEEMQHIPDQNYAWSSHGHAQHMHESLSHLQNRMYNLQVPIHHMIADGTQLIKRSPIEQFLYK